MSENHGAAFWDERYRGRAALWSGEPNPYLLQETAGLAAGRALDAGSGEGADAIWLAGRGWHVIAVDISAVAVGRAEEHARQCGADLAGRIEWIRQDLTEWEPGPTLFDLVTAQYLHLPPSARQPLFGRLAAAVAPGGSLLVVGHHPSDLETAVPRPQEPDRYFTGDDLLPLLRGGQWDVLTNTTPERSATDPDGRTVTVRDTVFRARRRD
ncbi:MAG TPA: class I SAM-dependent methyltransferase [Streptosporangiaceae bacterium]|nr:class I SAM-dependent methyltransferase [Streptosporangiaceae bacterium]